MWFFIPRKETQMKLSLRKAHALETALNHAAEEAMESSGHFQFSIFGDNLEEKIKQEKELVLINDKLLGKNLAETVDIPEGVAKLAEEFELI